MSAISKLIVKSITRVVKSTSKFDIIIDDIIDQFKNGCPPKPELLRLVAQKNQIQTALSGLGASISSLQTTATTTRNFISTVSNAVKIIKAIPIPTSVPPGVGIPINVITILADSLDTLGKLLDGAKGNINIIPTATKVMGESIQGVLEKLGELDTLVNECINELAAGLNQQEKNELIAEIGNSAATAGDFSNLENNIIDEEILINRLSNISKDPLIYKRFLLTIEFNDDNLFTFPQRRIKAYRERTTEVRQATLGEINWFRPRNPGFNGFVEDTYPEQTFTNLPDGGYSYSTSVKVLINEVKFRIDQEARLEPYKTAQTVQPISDALPDGGGISPVPRSTTSSGGQNPTGGSVGGSGGTGSGNNTNQDNASEGDFSNGFNPLGNATNDLNVL